MLDVEVGGVEEVDEQPETNMVSNKIFAMNRDEIILK